MIDIHCHILPNVDDGSQSLEQSIAMARAASAEGITHIIATPHHANGKYINRAADVQRAVQELNSRIEEAGIPITVLVGQEVRMYNELIEDFQESVVLTLHGSGYMLVELPSDRVPSGFAALIHELKVLGVTPIIAHPERNMELAGNPELLAALIEAGALSQITSHSVNGLFGSKLQKLCLQWCKRNLVHFVSSDAHNLKNRAFGLDRAYDYISRQLGSHYAERYQVYAGMVLRDELITPEKPLRVVGWRSLFSKWTRT
jgi:protein-tyrosine phosphatase